jgi:hypothetical protein
MRVIGLENRPDANAYCDYAEGLPEIVEILATKSKEIFLPSPVLGELCYGFLKGGRQRFNEERLNRFLNYLMSGLLILIPTLPQIWCHLSFACQEMSKDTYQ